VSTSSIVLADVGTDQLPGPCGEIGGRAIEHSQHPEPVGRSHQAQRVVPNLGRLARLQPVDELVQIRVVVRGGHAVIIPTAGAQAVRMTGS
jgi:hypothetical protein